MRSRDCRVCSLFQKYIPSFQPIIHSSHICVPFSGTFLVGVHPWAKKKKTKEKCKSLSAFSTREQGSTREFAGRTKFHVIFRRSTDDFPYTHQSTDCRPIARSTAGIVVTCLCVGGSCALPLARSCLCKTCRVFDGLAAAARQNARSYDGRDIFGQSDASTTKLANGTPILQLEPSAVVLVAAPAGCCSMY